MIRGSAIINQSDFAAATYDKSQQNKPRKSRVPLDRPFSAIRDFMTEDAGDGQSEQGTGGARGPICHSPLLV